MTEGASGDYVAFESGFDPGDPIDQAIIATQRAVFPVHGLMPLY
jgi:acetoin utilization protein AcuC